MNHVAAKTNDRTFVESEDAGSVAIGAAGGYRTPIRIGQRDLTILKRHHLFTDCLQCLHLLHHLVDRLLEVSDPAGQNGGGSTAPDASLHRSLQSV